MNCRVFNVCRDHKDLKGFQDKWWVNKHTRQTNVLQRICKMTILPLQVIGIMAKVRQSLIAGPCNKWQVSTVREHLTLDLNNNIAVQSLMLLWGWTQTNTFALGQAVSGSIQLWDCGVYIAWICVVFWGGWRYSDLVLYKASVLPTHIHILKTGIP